MIDVVQNPFWVQYLPWLIMGGWLLYSLLAISFRAVRDLNFYIFESIPSTFVTMGLLGTIGGISYGLSEFDTSPDLIKESIQTLLNGLKTAMYTTLAGVFLSLIFAKIIQVQLKGRRIKMPDSPELIELRSLNQHFESMDGQFQEFQKEFLYSQRNAMKQGLENTLEQFNRIMDEFITQLVHKNFEELSGAVKQLTDWQIEHREDVKMLKNTYREFANDNERLVRNSAAWVEKMDEIAGQSSKLQAVIDEFNDAFSEKGNLSKILQDIKGTTNELHSTTGEFRALATSLSTTTNSMQLTGEKIDSWTQSVAKVSDASGQMVANVSQLRTLDQEKLNHLFSSIDELFLTYIKDLEERLTQIPVHDQ